MLPRTPHPRAPARANRASSRAHGSPWGRSAHSTPSRNAACADAPPTPPTPPPAPLACRFGHCPQPLGLPLPAAGWGGGQRRDHRQQPRAAAEVGSCHHAAVRAAARACRGSRRCCPGACTSRAWCTRGGARAPCPALLRCWLALRSVVVVGRAHALHHRHRHRLWIWRLVVVSRAIRHLATRGVSYPRTARTAGQEGASRRQL